MLARLQEERTSTADVPTSRTTPFTDTLSLCRLVQYSLKFTRQVYFWHAYCYYIFEAFSDLGQENINRITPLT
jgi:hypothetical protein